MRIDEFSNMGAGVAGLSDLERSRFLSIGFDILAAALANGLVKLALALSVPGVAFTGAVPNITFTGKVE